MKPPHCTELRSLVPPDKLLLFGYIMFVLTGCWTPISYDDAETKKRDAEIESEHRSAPITETQTESAPELNSDVFADVESSLIVSPDGPSEISTPADTQSPSDPFSEEPLEVTTSAAPESTEQQAGFSADVTNVSQTLEPSILRDTAAVDLVVPQPLDASSYLSPSNTRRAAWLLGGKLSLAVLASELGGDVEDKDAVFEEAQQLAELLSAAPLNLSLSETGSIDNDRPDEILRSLLPLGRQVGREIAKTHGRPQAALFEVAFKSNILLVLYEPDSPLVESVAKALQVGAEKAGLPERLWQPVIRKLAARPEPAEIDEAIFTLHRTVDEYLALTE